MSWKQYGGISNFDKFNNMTMNSIVTDNITIKNGYYGTFDICGNFNVTNKVSVGDSLRVGGNVDISKNLVVVGDTTVQGRFTISGSADFTGSMDVSGNAVIHQNADICGNTFIGGNTTVVGNAHVYQKLYLGSDLSMYFFGDMSGIGLNVPAPSATLDISGNRSQILNVYSSQPTNTNIIARNVNNKGIVVSTNDSSSSILFYNDTAINANLLASDARIQYKTPGILQLDVSSNTQIMSRATISYRKNTYDISHVNNETLVVYDISAGSYFPDYYRASSASSYASTTGNALSLISNDNSSNTFLKMSAPNRIGFAVGGGAYPKDVSRGMGTFGCTDISGNYIPSQVVTSGNSVVKYHSTVGINTFAPKTDTYVLDVNGPIHVNNGEITKVYDASFEIFYLGLPRSVGAPIVSVGTPIKTIDNKYPLYALYSSNNGEIFDISNISNSDIIKDTSNIFKCGYVDASFSIVAGTTGKMYFTKNPINQTNYWDFLSDSLSYTGDIYSLYFKDKDASTIRLFRGIDKSSENIDYFDILKTTFNTVNPTISRTGTVALTTIAKSMDGFGNILYVAGTGIQKINSILGTPALSGSSINSPVIYNCIKAYTDLYVIAVGVNVISYTKDGSNWTHNTSFTGITFNSVAIYDASSAVAVGNGGVVYYTNDGCATWNPMDSNMLNSDGKGVQITDASNKLTNVIITSSDSLVISSTLTAYSTSVVGRSKIYYCFLPNLFNRSNNHVLDICGSIFVSGDLNINDGGKIASNNASFSLINTGVRNIQFGGDASNIIIGNAFGGNTYIRHNLDVSGNANVAGYANVTGYANIAGNVDISGNQIIKSVYDAINVSPASSYTGALRVKGGASINSNLVVGKNIYCSTYDVLNQGTDVSTNMYFGYNNLTTNTINIGGKLGNPKTIINLGLNDTDSVVIGGNITFRTQNNLTIENKVIYLNDPVGDNSLATIDTNNPWGAGINIAFGNLSASGVIKVSDEVKNYTIANQNVADSNGIKWIDLSNVGGYIFKSPTPNNIYKNPVYFNTNSLKYPPIGSSTVPYNVVPQNISGGLMMLTPNMATTGAYAVDASYVVTISTIDVRDIMLKQHTDALANSERQVVTTDIQSKGNILADKSFLVNKALASKISNAAVDIVGNAMITRLGLNTNAVHNTATLEVSGNMVQSTGFIRQF